MYEEYRYYINYKLYSDKDYTEFKFDWDYPQLKDSIYQLGKGLARFNGKLVKWLQVIEDIQIFKQNYDGTSNGHYYQYQPPSEESILRYWDEAYSHCHTSLDDMFLIPEKQDITNKLFRECNITINSLSNDEWIRLWNKQLFINSIPFDIWQETKTYELLDALLKLKLYLNVDTVPYEEIETYYMTNIFNHLDRADINKVSIKNILKSKNEKIKKDLWFDKPVISAQDGWVVFRI